MCDDLGPGREQEPRPWTRAPRLRLHAPPLSRRGSSCRGGGWGRTAGSAPSSPSPSPPHIQPGCFSAPWERRPGGRHPDGAGGPGTGTPPRPPWGCRARFLRPRGCGPVFSGRRPFGRLPWSPLDLLRTPGPPVPPLPRGPRRTGRARSQAPAPPGTLSSRLGARLRLLVPGPASLRLPPGGISPAKGPSGGTWRGTHDPGGRPAAPPPSLLGPGSPGS